MNEPLPCAALMAGSAPDATPVDRYRTHAVLNQAEPACGFNAYTGDAVLRAAIAREAPWAQSLRGPGRAGRRRTDTGVGAAGQPACARAEDA